MTTDISALAALKRLDVLVQALREENKALKAERDRAKALCKALELNSNEWVARSRGLEDENKRLREALSELVAEHDLHWKEKLAELGDGYGQPEDTFGMTLAREALGEKESNQCGS